MSTARIRIAIVGLLLACFAAMVHAQALPARFDPQRDAEADLAYALAIAQRDGKRVIVDIGGEWCTWCHIMDRFLARDEPSRTLLARHYVLLKVNFSKENPNAALLARWPKVAGYPHLFVLAPDGTLLHSQDTGALEAGDDYDPRKFRGFLTRWAAGAAGRA